MRHKVSYAVQVLRSTGFSYLSPLAHARALVHNGLKRLWPNVNTPVTSGLLAAVLIAVAFLAGAWADLHIRSDLYRTAVGETHEVHLIDGSSVTLAPLTELRVRYLERFRNVSLLQGEAFFTVAHDVKRPFQVKTVGNIVRTVGTSFNVRSRSRAEAEVTVADGAVAILDQLRITARSVPEGAIVVMKGHAIRLPATSASAVRELTQAEIERKLAWRGGILIFAGESLSTVVEETNRFTPHKLVIADPSIADFSVGARFNPRDTESLVVALAALGLTERTVTRDGVQEIHLYGGTRAEEPRPDPSFH